jgi:hypothetical protein
MISLVLKAPRLLIKHSYDVMTLFLEKHGVKNRLELIGRKRLGYLLLYF